MLQENCYVVSDDTKECVIIDCGAYYDEEKNAIESHIREKQLSPKHLLVTHAHIDHNFGNRFIFDRLGLKPEVSADDEYLMNKLSRQPNEYFGMIDTEEYPPVEKYLKKSDVITFGNHQFTIIPTPGHTPGSVFYYCADEKIAFSGDTLFRFSIGRTDLEKGDAEAMDDSLHNTVAKMPWDTVVYPGHGDKTTIREEMFSNPYLGSLGIY